MNQVPSWYLYRSNTLANRGRNGLATRGTTIRLSPNAYGERGCREGPLPGHQDHRWPPYRGPTKWHRNFAPKRLLRSIHPRTARQRWKETVRVELFSDHVGVLRALILLSTRWDVNLSLPEQEGRNPPFTSHKFKAHKWSQQL